MYSLYAYYSTGVGAAGANPWGAAVFGAFSGFMEGMVAGLEWAIAGAIIKGVFEYYKWVLYAELCSTGYGAIVVAVLLILEYVFGMDFSKIFFNVSASFNVETMADSHMEVLPFKLTPILEGPAQRELLKASLSSYKVCPDVPMLLQGNSVANRWPAGFGKDRNGRVCRGSYNVGTVSNEHTNFYA